MTKIAKAAKTAFAVTLVAFAFNTAIAPENTARPINFTTYESH